MKKVRIIGIFCILMVLLNSISFAQAEMRVIAGKEEIEREEEVSIRIEINEIEVAAFTLEIYFDETKLEYRKGPENSNYTNHRVLFTWLSGDGKNQQMIQTEEFIFKAVQDGVASFVVLGEFYNEDGQKVEVDHGNLQLNIGKQKTEVTIVEEEETEKAAVNNAMLKVLRLDHEGISPDFRKEVKEYYFVANDAVNSLNVTAIPENKNATVNVIGNKNLNIGKNIIEIHVLSEDKTQEEVYRIYVTKTKDIKLANANLENLAVRQGFLNPEFSADETNYKIEVGSEVEKIDILAIPQSEKAEVTVMGNEKIEVGDNVVQINVIAEDKITNKKYQMIVHRRNQQEQEQYEEETKIQTERLSTILQEQQEEVKQQEQKSKGSMVFVVSGIILGCMIVAAIVYGTKKRQKPLT